MKLAKHQRIQDRIPKRRRGAQIARTKHKERIDLSYASRIEAFTTQLVLPAILAHIARRLGSNSASAKDFICGCDPSFADGLPLCERRRENCRYLQRAGKRPRETTYHHRRYKDIWFETVFDYKGPALRLKRKKPVPLANPPANRFTF